MKTLLALLAIWMSFRPAPTAEAPKPPQPTSIISKRQKLISAASAMVGWTEKTGRNDGREIDSILAAVGLQGKREPYCAAFIVKAGDDAFGRQANPFPRSAWSPDLVRNPTWTLARGGREPRPGDAAGIYFASKGRVAHVLIVEKWGQTVITIEGNTSPDAKAGSAADRDGGGVHKKRRSRSQIHSVRDWINE